MIKKSLRSLLLFLLVMPFSQVYGFTVGNNASQFLTRLSPNEGLSQSYVNKTIQDDQGFIWIATNMGLNRYDGYQVQLIRGPHDIFTKGAISTLFLDQQGYIWVSILYSGLYRLDPKTLHSKQFFSGKFNPNSSAIAEVIKIIQADDHSLWLAISDQVMLLDINTGKLTHFLTLPSPGEIVRDLLADGDWLFCATSKGLYRINLTSKRVELIKHRPKNMTDDDSDNAKSLYKDKRLGLLVGTVNGLFSLTHYLDNNSHHIKAKQLLADLNVWQILPYQNKYLVATNKGLYHFNPITEQSQFILKFSDSRFQITDDNILNVFADRSANLWLASRSQGVLVWSPLTQRFQNISASTRIKLSHDDVWSLFQSNSRQGKQGYLWIGTDNGLNRLNLNNGEMRSYLVEQDSKAVTGEQVIRAIFANSQDDNLLWLVNDFGLKIFNKSTGLISTPFYTKRSKNIFKHKLVYGINVVDNERIFFFTDLGHYQYNSVTGEIKTLPSLNKLAPAILSWAFLGIIDADKNKVLLTTSGHLYRYNLLTEQVDLLYKSPHYQPQSYDYVDSWVIDKQNILWLAMTGEGLIGIDYQTLKEKYRFDTNSGLPTNNIYGLQQDQNNNLWFSSQMGLYRFDPKSHHIENYTANDGLLANEYNSFAYTKLADQRLVFGSTRGITLFSPKDFIVEDPQRSHYQVLLTGIQLFSDKAADQEKLIKTTKIELAYDDYGLKLHFSTLQFLQQKQTQYNIDLLGPAPLHFQHLMKNELLLSKLPPGDYQLSITAINPLTGTLSKPLQLNIHSSPAPWLSTIAKFSYALIIFFIASIFIKVRNDRRRELAIEHEKVRASQAQMLLFGKAFSQINDWLLILASNKKPITANKAFLDVFVVDKPRKVPSLKYFLQLLGEQKYQEFGEIISSIKPRGSWQGEEVIATPANQQHPVLIKINAIATTDKDEINYYVVVIADISVQKNAEEKLRHLAHYDYLTNLPNRKLILEKIAGTITEHQHSDEKAALFFIDLDKFKQVNDSLGHHIGDELLKYVADSLIANVKARDIVARQSGDEFMILIERFHHIDDLINLAQRINQCLVKPIKIGGNLINISSSIGIAIFPDDATSSTELIRKADLAMIHAKQAGRSQFQFFTPEMNAKAHRRLELERELIQSFNNNEFVNYYQPIVDCVEQKIIGFEMLMRWPHQNGMISPMEFIPIAEEIGLISQLTEQAVERVLQDQVKLQQLFPDCYISVNLSAIHILQHGLCEMLQGLLLKYQLPASALRLEITEGTLLVDKKTALKRLQELKEQGFKLLLDDFGTGYSSLTYLSQFPIDVLKIDQSFVRNLQTNPMNKAIIQAIVSLANSLTLSCVAEGIEDKEQLAYIRALGCQQIQGYYFSQPKPINDLICPTFWQSVAAKLTEISS